MSHPSAAFHGIIHPEVKDYLGRLAGDDDPLLDRMEAYCRERGFPLIGRQSGRWLELLTAMIGGKRVFEFGSGFGYSAFFFARAVGANGVVIEDIAPMTTSVVVWIWLNAHRYGSTLSGHG